MDHCRSGGLASASPWKERAINITCLHTAESNVPVYEGAARDPDIALRHLLRRDLLDAAERAGGLTDEIRRETRAALEAAGKGADAVLLTCSTLGPVAETASGSAGVPVLRADQALAEAAVAGGGEVAVLCAVETTLAPTGDLFQRAAAATGAKIHLRLVAGAWAAFKAGAHDDYFALVAAAVHQALEQGAARVALAQSSMAPAAMLCTEPRPLTSPAAGLRAARDAALACSPAGASPMSR